MRITLRIALGYFLIVGLAGYLLFNTFVAEVKPGVKQAMEETMVDAANVLAELAADDLERGTLASGAFADAIATYRRRVPNATIYSLEKRSADFRIYVTDARGQVLFDSAGEDTGKDFSRWRDVYRTLRGEYGARATRVDPNNENTLVIYVAAPVYGREVRDGIRPMLGVLTLGKPIQTVEPFAQRAERRVTNAGLLLLGCALLIGTFFTIWLTHSVRKLRDFARDVAEDRRPAPPQLGQNELGELETAIHKMREKLDGRAYVEQYIQNLTHELKSPIAGIRAATEVLEDPRATPEEQQQFLDHIGQQTGRLTDIVDRMLELAQVEGLRHLDEARRIDLTELVRAEVTGLQARAGPMGVTIRADVDGAAFVNGDAFLLRRALANLLGNALEFSQREGSVTVRLEHHADRIILEIRDRGPGIPDYAAERIFERFYSLPRPDGRRSTGLGLPFAREIARLHRGDLDAANHEEGGFVARLSLPAG